MIAASPIPRREAVQGYTFPGGVPERWYVAETDDDGYPLAIRGGPFETEAEALAEIEAWRRELDELYDAMNGPGVCWGPR